MGCRCRERLGGIKFVVHGSFLSHEATTNAIQWLLHDMHRKLPSSDVQREQLKNILQLLKAGQFVHGDIRKQNILLLPNDGIKLLDFDWANDDGSAFYPHDLNMNVEWPDGVAPGGKITREHDRKQVASLLE